MVLLVLFIDNNYKSFFNEYITIETEKIKDEIIINKININKKEIENIGYMFRSDYFDMKVNINEKDIILSNKKAKENIDKIYYLFKQII